MQKKRQHSNDAGMALILVMIAIIVVLGAVVVSGHLVSAARNNTDIVTNMHLLEEACKAGVDFAIERLWNQYLITNHAAEDDLASYNLFIDGVVEDGATLDMLGGAPLVLNTRHGVVVEEISVHREDVFDGILLTVRVTAGAQASNTSGGAHRQRVEQTLRVSGVPFAGFEYAILSNNINCLLCHTGVYSIGQQLNTAPEQYGGFDRIKVATLEALSYRPQEADSVVAGAIYTRGQVYDERGQPLTPEQIVSSTALRSFEFSAEDGKLRETADGNLVGPVALRHAVTDADGYPEPYASLYTDYPTDPHLMTDGPLPDVFPAPFPDTNNNRYVDADEFDEVAQLLSGAISGGIVYGVPTGEYYAGPSLPEASNAALTAVSSTGRYDGNLILVGTEADPVRINGEVAVSGDLLIQGKVRGWGQLFVRGNTYITGDVVYDDAPGYYGVAEDGTENALAIIAGGSVLMGDYLTIRGKNHREDRDLYPDWSSGAILARVAHQSNLSPPFEGTRIILDRGYFDAGVIDAGEIMPTMIDLEGNEVLRQGQQFSFTQSALQMFNNLELEKALNDPDYVPRFYGLRDTQPNNIYLFMNTYNEKHGISYTNKGVVLLTEYLISEGINPDTILDRAAFHYMNPTGHWISEETLRQIWWEDEMQREMGDIWLFDGLLYSNNAIFGITRSYRRKGSHTNACMRVRGAIIAPDLGLLAPGADEKGKESCTLLYDPRVREFLAPHDTTRAFLQRMVYRIIPLTQT